MKDLSKFLSEKKEDKSKARPAKKDEGVNDEQFLALMSEYKQLRRRDTEAANKLLKQAQGLKDVSKKAKLAAAYL
ncbi:hypothetical protein [Synechococcus phage S-B68]|nr:hypothetical protein [Synechococcus phage S-B68]